MTSLSGVVGALLTPFDERQGVDRTALEREYDFLASHCDAVSVLGAEVSEYRMLDPRARRELLVEAVTALRGRCRVLAGVSAPRPGEVLELAELAAGAGAEMVQLLLPARPSGGPARPAELVDFVEHVAARSPLPMVLYHHPGLGADPSFETLVACCAVDNVVAIKDSSRDISRNLRAVAEIDQAGHARYLATIQPMLAVLATGGAGAMTPAPFTLVAAALRDAVADGDLERAGRVQGMVARLPGAWAAEGLLALAKAACAELGLPLGDPAPPYHSVSAALRREIADIVAGWSGLLDRTLASAGKGN